MTLTFHRCHVVVIHGFSLFNFISYFYLFHGCRCLQREFYFRKLKGGRLLSAVLTCTANVVVVKRDCCDCKVRWV